MKQSEMLLARRKAEDLARYLESHTKPPGFPGAGAREALCRRTCQTTRSAASSGTTLTDVSGCLSRALKIASRFCSIAR